MAQVLGFLELRLGLAETLLKVFSVELLLLELLLRRLHLGVLVLLLGDQHAILDAVVVHLAVEFHQPVLVALQEAVLALE